MPPDSADTVILTDVQEPRTVDALRQWHGEVHALLTQSRAAHTAKKRAAGLTDKHGNVTSHPNYPKAEQHIADALRLRLEAHDLDPDHTAPAWRDDTTPHAQLVAFYTEYLTIP